MTTQLTIRACLLLSLDDLLGNAVEGDCVLVASFEIEQVEMSDPVHS